MKKTMSCEEILNLFAQKLKVCGHPMRLQLLIAIAQGESSCVTELWRCLGQSQPVVSQHLAVLKDQNIVDSKIEKNKRIYTIVDPFIREIISLMLKDELLKDKELPGSKIPCNEK
ncbi:MAG: helix-turn-helix transcriptional regulator [Spirochaetales bacterium]|nr:helix-turn-helix transcriptional regulator [Spirochaetales bacterium]